MIGFESRGGHTDPPPAGQLMMGGASTGRRGATGTPCGSSSTRGRQCLGSDAVKQRLDIVAVTMAVGALRGTQHELTLGLIDNVVALDVRRLEILRLVGHGSLHAHAERAQSLEIHRHRVLQMAAQALRELDEHRHDVGTRHRGGVSDLSGQVLRLHMTQTHGAAIPLAIVLRTLHLDLILLVTYTHCFFDC